MNLLESVQILAAVRRSLEAHVLPEVPGEFARLQVIAALKALDEVQDRLANGDPCERANIRLESDLRDAAAELRGTDPAVAESLTSALTDLPESPEPRDRTRALGERLTGVLRDAEAPGRKRVVDVLRKHATRTAGEDTVWMCREAIESLQ